MEGGGRNAMIEPSNKAQPKKLKLRTLAVWLLCIGFLLACALGIVAAFIVSPFAPTFRLLYVAVFVLCLSGISGLVMAIFSLIQLKWCHKRVLRHGLAEFGIVAAALFVILLGLVLHWAVGIGSLVICGMKMSGLGKVVAVYANDYDGKYPTAEKWCDLLVQLEYVTEEQFRCPGNKKERCSYALNPYCAPNSPNDVVLLFETKGGWNQHGGPDILTTENHGGKGCNILFNDGSVRFVKTEELGQLKWTVEETADE
jgi:prepilin-type processing-associated H-X9-DG protein